MTRCVDKKTSKPIHGLATSLVEAIEGPMGEMDCACAREVELLRDMGCKMLVNYNIDNQAYSQQYKKCMEGNWDKYFLGHLRCLHNGNFDPVQCIPKVGIHL